MLERKALLIGSMPFDNEEEAMKRAIDILGPYLLSVPDGEIGEKSPEYPKGRRAAWIQTVTTSCLQDTQNFKVVRDMPRDPATGFQKGYDTPPLLRPRHLPSCMDKHLRFGYDEFFEHSYPIFKRLRDERGFGSLKFQVGVPTGLDLTFTMLGRVDALRYARAFSRRVAREVERIVDTAGDDVVIQVEVPGELAMAHKLPGLLVGMAAKSVVDLLKMLPERATIGLHLCFGDLHNRALIKPKTLRRTLKFANKLIDKWPLARPPSYIHIPLAAANEPSPLEHDFYRPLAVLRIPSETRFVAGFVHERRSVVDHRRILHILDNLRGGPVDIACSCGLGRRTPKTAERLLELTREILDAR